MEEAQEYNIQTYELNQGGKDYILTTGLINDNIRITCRDHLELTGPYYLNINIIYIKWKVLRNITFKHMN